jgi:hypothetical protein
MAKYNYLDESDDERIVPAADVSQVGKKKTVDAKKGGEKKVGGGARGTADDFIESNKEVQKAFKEQTRIDSEKKGKRKIDFNTEDWQVKHLGLENDLNKVRGYNEIVGKRSTIGINVSYLEWIRETSRVLGISSYELVPLMYETFYEKYREDLKWVKKEIDKVFKRD